MSEKTSLGDRLSAALGAEDDDACPGDLAIAAENVFADWLREQADVHKDTDVPVEKQIRYELLALALSIVEGTA